MDHTESGSLIDYKKYLNNKKIAPDPPTTKGEEGNKKKEVSSFNLISRNKGNQKKQKGNINNTQRIFYKNIADFSMNDIRAEKKTINNQINSLKKSNDSDMDYKNKITILKEKAQELEKELERRESCPQQTKTIQLNDKEEEINIYNCEMVLNNQRIKGNIALLEEDGIKTTNSFTISINPEEDEKQHFKNTEEKHIKKTKMLEVYSISYHISSSIINILQFICKRVKSRYNFRYINMFADFMKIIQSNIDENKYVGILENETLISFLWKIIDKDKKRYIELLLKMERENKNEKIKLINLLFSTKLKKIFDLYLIDYRYFNWNNKCELHLTDLKTFENCINKNGKEIKNYIINLLENDINNAKKASNSLTNSSLKKTTNEEVLNQPDIKNNEEEEIQVNNGVSKSSIE